MAKKVSKKKSKKVEVPSSIRDAIRERMKTLELSAYEMTKRLQGRVSRTAVYRFVNDGGSPHVATAEAFLSDLGLKVVRS
jgi:DNA-binding phage protein